MTSSTASSTHVSAMKMKKTFLDLPAEIRNSIYILALTLPHHIKVLVSPGIKPWRFGQGGQLRRTCRQVHAEARAVLYGGNRFEFSYGIHVKPFFDWIGDSCRHMRQIRVDNYYLPEIELALAMLAGGNDL
ncbi:hypothetical protein CLAFUW4_13197 [Fulvia fulva]|uniref:F-box domain-containing protein n=1 Tax=Passalora fulva TaxID=5499 RepID=A0A9Q8PJM2_PASFU|nr:uncharacterized protein CLAFUR5_13054 [Fulvia fulva]KAK4611928.1 hypothetical protein CLAFUR4_13202 [Fulvia fulva]KAK4612470.1 hypothetical protein CLAFUR0_13206 [Fulvia fulva]UJO23630.1 hypothetical protein CLAFUR5_13054 [Fulvia fulva]WPV21275.1 hypothetical protein CLAFUW4_13197 [Fulvia fulva]WPV36237.1 hypothetical protein CLAFUW7_13205 [Fulvia fulva]